MAGIDGGVGGQQPIRPADSGPIQRSGEVGKSQAPQAPGADNLSVSHTQGTQQAGRATPMAGIPAPSPEVSNMLATMNTQDLQALLAGLQEESSQVQQDMATANAEAKKAEVKEMQETRSAELEQLQSDKAQAEHEVRCAEAKMAFANIFSLGISSHTSAHQDLLTQKAEAQLKIATIDLQMNGMVSTPPPTLSEQVRQTAMDFATFAGDPLIRDDRARDIAKNKVDERFLNNEIDRETQVALRAMLDDAPTAQDFLRSAVLSASQDQAATGATPPPQAAPAPVATEQPDAADPAPIASTAPAVDTDSVADDTAWLAEMTAMMNAQEDEMNEVIARLEDANSQILKGAADGNAIASMRFVGV